jgi:hypothetical protein
MYFLVSVSSSMVVGSALTLFLISPKLAWMKKFLSLAFWAMS